MTELGLRYLRQGFAQTPELDRALALGWPEVRFIGDVEGVPKEIAGRCFVWTREDAEARLRERFAKLTIACGASFGYEEALAFARHVIPFGWRATFDETETDLFLLEELVGPDVLADAMTSALEEISPNEWQRADRNAHVPHYLLGFVLLRTEMTKADAIRTRLEKVFDRRRDEGGVLGQALDLILHGAEGARRSGLRRGPNDADLDPSFVLLADDPLLIDAVVRAEGFARWDRRFAARLAFLGGDAVIEPIVDRWYSVGDARAQEFFLETVGRLASPALVESMREAANASLVRAKVVTWMAERGESLTPAEVPSKPHADTITVCETDEFGFVLLPEESAAQLRGDEDHTILTEGLDATSLLPLAVTAFGRAGVIFCRTDRAGFCENADGVLFTYGVHDEEMPAIFAAAPSRRWMKLNDVIVETTFVGLSASVTLADARADGRAVTLPLSPGRYVVRQALLTPEVEDADELPPLLWFRRRM